MSLIFLSLFVVTVIDNFDFFQQEDAMYSLVTMDDLSKFRAAWAEFDPKGTGYLKKEDLTKFLRKCGGRLEIRIYDDSFTVPSLMERSKGAPIPNVAKREISNPVSALLGEAPLSGRMSPPSLDVIVLQKNLNTMDSVEVRQRRAVYNFAYQEIMSFEDPEKGLPFDAVLKVLTYQLIDAERFLKIDQMFIRQQQLSQVQERVYRDKVRAVCHTFALRRRFRKLQELKLAESHSGSDGHRHQQHHPEVSRDKSDLSKFSKDSSAVPRIKHEISLPVPIPTIVVEPEPEQKAPFTGVDQMKDSKLDVAYLQSQQSNMSMDMLNMSNASALSSSYRSNPGRLGFRAGVSQSGITVGSSSANSLDFASGQDLEQCSTVLEDLSKSSWMGLLDEESSNNNNNVP